MQKTIEFIAPVPYTGYVLYSVSRVVKNVIPEGGIILPDETQTVTRNRVSNIVTFWKDDFLFYGNKGWEHNHVGLKIHTKLDCIDVIWKRGEKVAEVVRPDFVNHVDYRLFSGAFSGIGVDKPAAELKIFRTFEPKRQHFDFSDADKFTGLKNTLYFDCYPPIDNTHGNDAEKINFDFEMPPVEPEAHEVEFLDVLTFLTKAKLEDKQKQIITNLLSKA